MNGINVYGISLTEKEIEQQRQDKINGIIRYHETTYIEREIPNVLEKEISDYIDKKVKEFENSCQCEDCKEQKK